MIASGKLAAGELETDLFFSVFFCVFFVLEIKGGHWSPWHSAIYATLAFLGKRFWILGGWFYQNVSSGCIGGIE